MSNGIKILLVDDDAAVLMAVGDRLTLEGYDVNVAAGGEQALQVLRATVPDLIILDIGMPGMNGLAFLKRISGADSRPRYPVLVFTARANMEKFFKEAPVDGFLPKTSDPNQLIEEVQRIVLSRRAATGGEADSRHRRRRVLIVESETRVGLRMNAAFTAAGYDTAVLPDTSDLIASIRARHPDVMLIRQILSGMTGTSVAANLADFTRASGMAIIVYDSSGIHPDASRFPNVARFLPTDAPAELLKAVASVLG